MNCKKGDIAMVIRGGHNVGKVVQCERLATSREVIAANVVSSQGPVWVISPPLLHTDGIVKPYATDAGLRPIRDPGDEAVDEMLLLVGSPNWEAA